jgi:hypothetical protein
MQKAQLVLGFLIWVERTTNQSRTILVYVDGNVLSV